MLFERVMVQRPKSLLHSHVRAPLHQGGTPRKRCDARQTTSPNARDEVIAKEINMSTIHKVSPLTHTL